MPAPVFLSPPPSNSKPTAAKAARASSLFVLTVKPKSSSLYAVKNEIGRRELLQLIKKGDKEERNRVKEE
jgi:hypothetical protein